MTDLELQRYTWDHLDEWYYPDTNGEWVKWEDVKILLSGMTGTLDKVLTDLHDMNECTSEMIKKARENYYGNQKR